MRLRTTENSSGESDGPLPVTGKESKGGERGLVERKQRGSNTVGSEGGSGRRCPSISLVSHVSPHHLQADRETGMNHSAPRGVISTGTDVTPPRTRAGTDKWALGTTSVV